MSLIKSIVKRDGTVVPFDRDRIATAIFKAAAEVGGTDRDEAASLAKEVEVRILSTFGEGYTPSVEEIQDIVEETLIKAGHVKTARAYILYRHERAMARTQRAVKFEAPTTSAKHRLLMRVTTAPLISCVALLTVGQSMR